MRGRGVARASSCAARSGLRRACSPRGVAFVARLRCGGIARSRRQAPSLVAGYCSGAASLSRIGPAAARLRSSAPPDSPLGTATASRGLSPGPHCRAGFDFDAAAVARDIACIVGNATVCCGSKCIGATWIWRRKVPPRFGACVSASQRSNRCRSESAAIVRDMSPSVAPLFRRSERHGKRLEPPEQRRLAPLRSVRNQGEIRHPLHQRADRDLAFDAG